MLPPWLMAPLVIFTACTDTENSRSPSDTSECKNYRSMMTAPLPPQHHNELRMACEKSRRS